VNYTDDFTQATYTLNTRTLAFEDAEDICNDIGGHAVSYGGIAEQVAVENFYVSKVSCCRMECIIWLTACEYAGLLSWVNTAGGGSLNVLAMEAHQSSNHAILAGPLHPSVPQGVLDGPQGLPA
jgi:hypothetical protein